MRRVAGHVAAGLWAAAAAWVGVQALMVLAPGGGAVDGAPWESSGVRPGAPVGALVAAAAARSAILGGSALALGWAAAVPVGRRWAGAAALGAAPAWLLLFFGLMAVNAAVHASPWRPAWHPLPEGGGIVPAALAGLALALGPLGALAGAYARGAAAAAAGDVARATRLAGGDPARWVEAAGRAAARAQLPAQVPAVVGALVLVEPAVRVRGLGWLAWRALETRDAAVLGAVAVVLAGGLGAAARPRVGGAT